MTGEKRHFVAQEGVSPEEIKDAYRQAVRMASRCSVLGALGFGLALAMLVFLTDKLELQEALFGTAYPLERFLLAGGLVGGLLFTWQAWRASRLAKVCYHRLEHR